MRKPRLIQMPHQVNDGALFSLWRFGPAILELHLRRLALGGILDLEELGWREIEHPGNHARRENLPLRVVGHHGVVVGLPRKGDLVLRRGEFLLESHHILVGLEVGISFGNHHKAAESPREAGFRAGERLHRLWIARVCRRLLPRALCDIPRLGDGFECLALVFEVPFRGLDEVRDEIVSTLELYVDLGKRIFVAVTQSHETIVLPDEKQADNSNENNQYDDNGEGGECERSHTQQRLLRPAGLRNSKAKCFFPRKIPSALISQSAMPIRAILFDLDDTLIVDEAVSHAALEATAQHAFTTLGANREEFLRDAREHARRLHSQAPVYPYCRRIGISAFECLWGNFLGDTTDLTALREWAHAYRVQVFDAALRSQELEGGEAATELAAVFSTQRRRLQRLMPDAREVITRLSKKYRVGLLTNGAPDLQREKLLASSLEPLLHAVAVSGEHDIGKPLPEIFHRLLAELGVTAAEAVMVGNSLERDILGARNAGITSIWLKVPGSEEPADVHPDYTILGLAELPALIERLDRPAAD